MNEEIEGYEIVYILPRWAYTAAEYTKLIQSIDLVGETAVYRKEVQEPEDVILRELLGLDSK